MEKKVCCPECKSTEIGYDNKHCETVCKGCGLVLMSPPIEGIVFPGFLIIKQE